MADHNLDIAVQYTMLPFIEKSYKSVSEIDTSIFKMFHTDSEEILGKYSMERNGNSVVLTEEFTIYVYDKDVDADVAMDCSMAYHFIDEKFRSAVLYAVVLDHSSPVYYVGGGMNPFSHVEPARVNKVCFSLYIGDKKYLISDTFYDKIDFEAQAFQQSTISGDVIGLPLAQKIIKTMGVTQ